MSQGLEEQPQGPRKTLPPRGCRDCPTHTLNKTNQQTMNFWEQISAARGVIRTRNAVSILVLLCFTSCFLFSFTGNIETFCRIFSIIGSSLPSLSLAPASLVLVPAAPVLVPALIVLPLPLPFLSSSPPPPPLVYNGEPADLTRSGCQQTSVVGIMEVLFSVVDKVDPLPLCLL